MIDTVRMTGDYQIVYELLDRAPWTNNYFYENRSDNNGMVGEVFEYKKKGEAVRLKYNQNTERMTVEVSIPKFLFGHNVQMVRSGDISRFFQRLNDYLRNKFYAYPKHEPFYWKVQRMDVCWNFQVGAAVKDYIQAFSHIHISRYATCAYGGGETVVWQNRSKRMSFYDKQQEVKARKGLPKVVEQSQGILRFEANVTDKNLLKYSTNRWAGELIKESVAKDLLVKHLHRLGIDNYLKVSNRKEIATALIKKYGESKAWQLLGFIEYKLIFGDQSLNRPSKTTYDRRINELKSIGIEPMYTNKELPPLNINEIMI
jgi:hypothetical protein